MKRKRKNRVWSLLIIFTFIVTMLPQTKQEVFAQTVANDNSSFYRSGFHFSPTKNWMNDPNGMVYYDGEYHLFYQHNPTSLTWGPMYWGHAVSKDLVNWEHLPIALYPDELGFIWSGSVVIDWNNTSGFGEGSKPPMVAMFTQEKGGKQVQSLAYSNDRGRSWVTYEGNPIIPMISDSDVFRDPKVFWHQETEKWVMVISAGNHIKIYQSKNLINWKNVSDFGFDQGSLAGTWECPDLFELKIDGDPNNTKWVLAVSISEGAPAGGSGMQYFIGNFDGTTFTNDHEPGKVLWADYGSDFYAAVTWSDVPQEDGRRIWLGWMNNWLYGQNLPTTEFRGTMSLPRELTLTKTVDNEIRLVQKPVDEFEHIRANKKSWLNETVGTNNDLLSSLKGKQFQIIAEFEISSVTATEFGFNVHKGETTGTKVGYDLTEQQLFIDRKKSGSSFHDKFAAKHVAPYISSDDTIKMNLFIDSASIEVFGKDGEVVITDLIFPSQDDLALELYTVGGEVVLKSLDVYEMKSAEFISNVEKVSFDPNNLPNEIENPDFETGDLTGWTEVGSAFDHSVSNVTSFWGGPFNHQGAYHVWGFSGAKEDATSDLRAGILKSSVFQLAGNGVIDFLVAGGQDINNLYVALVRASDGKELFKATGANTEAYRRVKWDASEYIGEALYIKVVDFHSGGFGHINVDDFRVYNNHPILTDDIENPDFETGDLTGWTVVEGDAFSNENVTDVKDWGWGGPFNHSNKYHLWGAKTGDDKTGILKSSHFILSGSGEISFLIGGGNDIENLYVALVRASDDQELMKETNKNFADSEAYSKVTWDASKYLGKEVYLKIVDKATGGWGHINVDDFQVKTRGIIAHWAFNEEKGARALDEVSGIEDAVEYVFNQAKYKPSTDPLWKQGVKNNALLFDGYSTWITRKAEDVIKPSSELTIEAWVAPRSYEWGDLGQLSAIVNQHNRSTSEGYMLGMGKHGKWSFQASVDGEWKEVWANESNPLEKEKWSYIVATFSQTEKKMKLYLNGELVGEESTPNGILTPSSQNLIIGKHNSAAVINGAFTANMFNGLIDELKIHNQAITEDEIQQNYQSVIQLYDGGKLPTPDLKMDRSRYDGDRYRPQYHLISPEHWMNEPHGPIHYNGKYHIFYQHNPQGPYWHQIHWGHLVSDDMVHWEDAPVALAPTANSVSPDGVWSGDATIDKDGNPVLLFTAGDDSKFPNQMTGLATSNDPTDPLLKDWTMYEKPVTVQAPKLSAEQGEVWYGQFRDPFVWKDGDTWYQLVGSGIRNVGGTALLYTSKDLIEWKYEKPLFVGDYKKHPKTGEVWELPVFLPVGEDKDGNKKYAFFINPWFENYSPHNVKYVWYWTGTWDKEKLEFIPDFADPKQFDYGEHFTGPSGMVDDNGRSILFSITQDRRTEQQHYDAGWAHNGGLPLELSLSQKGELIIEPIKELQSLRKKEILSIKNSKIEKVNQKLKDVKGDMLEIQLEFDLKKENQVGLKLRKSSNGEEETLLFYDTKNQKLSVDRSKSSLDPDISKGIQGGELKLDGDNLKLHIYLDRSMLEAYANSKKSITTRVYPTLEDSLGLELWSSHGKATVKSINIWELGSAYGEKVPAYWPSKVEVPAHGELTNHDFQTGDLTGWEVVEGDAFSDKHVTKVEDWGWGGPFNQASDRIDPERYHLWGFNGELGGDALTGILKSEDFKLGGNGQIDFLIGGGKNMDKLYVALVRKSDDKELLKATGHNSEAYRRVRWDASMFIGEELYIKVVDKETGGWGHINLDDVNVPVK